MYLIAIEVHYHVFEYQLSFSRELRFLCFNAFTAKSYYPNLKPSAGFDAPEITLCHKNMNFIILVSVKTLTKSALKLSIWAKSYQSR